MGSRWDSNESRKSMTETPLKYTCRGNWPIADLTYEVRWEDSPDLTIFREFWYFPDGELASNNVQAYGRKPLDMGVEQAKIG